MPLNYEKPKSPRFIAKFRNVLNQTLNLFRPENSLLILIIASIILAFKYPIGFYVFASIFIVCYFIERIFRFLPKKE